MDFTRSPLITGSSLPPLPISVCSPLPLPYLRQLMPFFPPLPQPGVGGGLPDSTAYCLVYSLLLPFLYLSPPSTASAPLLFQVGQRSFDEYFLASLRVPPVPPLSSSDARFPPLPSFLPPFFSRQERLLLFPCSSSQQLSQFFPPGPKRPPNEDKVVCDHYTPFSNAFTLSCLPGF